MPLNPVHGAKYLSPNNIKVVLHGYTVNKAWIAEQEGELYFIPLQEFLDTYTETGEHDHVSYCCHQHDTHTTPHKGCILR